MKRLSRLLLLTALLVAGCGKSEETTPETLNPRPRESPTRFQPGDWPLPTLLR
jgi:hypothetical protein